MSLDRARLLYGALAALVLILILEWAWPAGRAGGDVAPAQFTTPKQAAAAAARETADWEQTVLARPLFSISRRPARMVSRAGDAVVAGQARLAGIMITRFGKRAIFAPEGGGKQMVLPEGASVNDSTIRRIQADRVILASGTVLLPTYDHNPSSFGTTPPFRPSFTPNFPAPAFPNPAFQNSALPNQAFPNQAAPGGFAPGFQAPGPQFAPQVPQQFQPPNEAGDQAPPFRGGPIPQRRE